MLLDPVAFAAELAEHPVDMLVYTPTLLEALSQVADLAAFLPNRVLVVAGEAFPPRLAQAIVRVRPDLPTFNSYGPSEATIEVTQHRVRPADLHRSTIPIGRPLDGVTMRVLDEHGQPVPDRVAGILHIGGQCLARGYVNDPSATARKFQVAESGERLYRTDDIVRLNADGNYEFIGRSDRQVKIRGHRVEPGEVETALLAQPGIRSFCEKELAPYQQQWNAQVTSTGTCGPRPVRSACCACPSPSSTAVAVARSRTTPCSSSRSGSVILAGATGCTAEWSRTTCSTSAQNNKSLAGSPNWPAGNGSARSR
jgi:acyl-CoA synthetase (AMP-forming)/AMP-acid ligase II